MNDLGTITSQIAMIDSTNATKPWLKSCLKACALAALGLSVSVGFAQASAHKSLVKSQSHITTSHWVMEAGLGGGDFTGKGTNNESFSVTHIETDSLTQQSAPTHLFYMLGFQRSIPVSTKRGHGIIEGLQLGPVLYYQPGSFKGEVNQFKVKTLNNYNYQYKIKPWNVYFEMDLKLHSFWRNHIQPYVFIGGGVSIVDVSYEEETTPVALALGVPANSALSRRSDTETGLSYELGAGINITLPSHIYLGVRYVYQQPNAVQISGATPRTVGTGQISPIRANIATNSGYIIIGYRFP